MAIMLYSLYREAKSTLQLVKATAKTVQETVTMVREGIKPMLPIMAIVQGVRGGFEFIKKMFGMENNGEGDSDE